jgi:hypothetical protein
MHAPFQLCECGMKFLRYIKKRWQLWLTILLMGWLLYRFRYDVAEWVRNRLGIELPEDPRPAGITDLQWCENNYKEEMQSIAGKLDLPYEYLMALAVLECGGNKPAGHRFEKHVYNQLKDVRDGKRKKYENIRQEDLADLDDEGLKNLATSWGPFQLMGYKVIPMKLNIVDIREEEDAAFYAAKWIKEEYGHFLTKKKWKDAFHYHNTGKRFPLNGRSRTHNPYYVSDGVKYMKYFGTGG